MTSILMRRACMLLLLPLGAAGCDGADPTKPQGPTSPSTPSLPSLPTAPSPPPSTPPTAAIPATPSVIAIVPSVGSVDGATRVKIIGAGFRPGAVVRFGGVLVAARPDHRDPLGTILYLEVPAHAAGTVHVTVTNVDGQASVRHDGYTFAPAASFDFNGQWGGFGNHGQDIPILFTIRDNRVVSVSCDDHVAIKFATPPVVRDGAFSYNANGVVFAGRIVSATQAVGTIHLGPCTDTNWSAESYSPPP